jgi:hypothetical protein
MFLEEFWSVAEMSFRGAGVPPAIFLLSSRRKTAGEPLAPQRPTFPLESDVIQFSD